MRLFFPTQSKITILHAKDLCEISVFLNVCENTRREKKLYFGRIFSFQHINNGNKNNDDTNGDTNHQLMFRLYLRLP